MHRTRPFLAVLLFAALLLAPGCADRDTPSSPPSSASTDLMKAEPGDDAAGNCLSYPVLWAEGAAKALRIPPRAWNTRWKENGGTGGG